MAKKTLYLANPYGFSEQQKAGPLRELVDALASLGADVREPFALNSNVDMGKPDWAWNVARMNMVEVRNADGVFAVVNGCPPDEGVMVEVGMAIAWNKPLFLFRDDFRRCSDSKTYPINLMAFGSLPAKGWEDYWYGSAAEICDSAKALRKWIDNP